jgi:hypothetical protein
MTITERYSDELLELALSDCVCASDWDQDRAARWWRDADRAQAMRVTVS